MILAAYQSSPATAEALIHELNASQPQVLGRLVKAVPGMIPKAYRWVGEMREISGFVGEGEGEIYEGIAKLYERVERSLAGDGKDVEVLNSVVEKAKKTVERT